MLHPSGVLSSKTHNQKLSLNFNSWTASSLGKYHLRGEKKNLRIEQSSARSQKLWILPWTNPARNLMAKLSTKGWKLRDRATGLKKKTGGVIHLAESRLSKKKWSLEICESNLTLSSNKKVTRNQIKLKRTCDDIRPSGSRWFLSQFTNQKKTHDQTKDWIFHIPSWAFLGPLAQSVFQVSFGNIKFYIFSVYLFLLSEWHRQKKHTAKRFFCFVWDELRVCVCVLFNKNSLEDVCSVLKTWTGLSITSSVLSSQQHDQQHFEK